MRAGLFFVCILMTGVACAREWSPGLVTAVDAWRKEGTGQLSVDGQGLRLEVGKDWVGAAMAGLVLPKDAGMVRLKVALGNGGRFTVKFTGDQRGDGKQRTYSPAWGQDIEGVVDRPLDPRGIDPRLGHPELFDIAIEGKPGAWGRVSEIDFLPGYWKAAPSIAGQKGIRGIDLMPNLPRPYIMLDWRNVCRNFDTETFNTKARGQYLPLCRLWDDALNPGRKLFAQTTYIGDNRAAEGAGESLVSLWALVSATVCGIDTRKQDGVDWVNMADEWLCTEKGINLLTDYRNGPTALNYWYDQQPTTAYAMLVDLYPGRPDAERTLKTSVDTLARVHDAIRGPDGVPDYDFSGFDYRQWKPATEGTREPDNAGGAAWIFYMAYRHFGDREYLDRARDCFRFLDKFGTVPIVETGLAWGAYTAARMNAELGTDLPADKYIQRCFELSQERGEQTVITADKWGGADVSGMWGDMAAKDYYYESLSWSILANVARYDPSYARVMGKWMLNLASTARYFFPDQLPPDAQTDWAWQGDPTHCIPYERISTGRRGKWIFGMSDAVDLGWPTHDLSLYSGAMTGFLGGRIAKTQVEGILRIDLLAFDTFRDRAWPTFLIYNPHSQDKTICLDVGNRRANIYDAASKRFIARQVRGAAGVVIPADRAIVAVITPADGKVSREGRRLLVDGVVADYSAG